MPVQELHKTARYELQLWLWEQVEGKSRLHLPTLTEQAVLHFSEKKGWLEKYAKEVLYRTVKTEVEELLSEARRRGGKDYLKSGESLVTEDELAERASRLVKRWSSWYERVGDGHKRLLDMTKEDLVVAAASRRTAAHDHERLAILFDQLAEQLEEDVTVGAIFTVEQIEALSEAIQ